MRDPQWTLRLMLKGPFGECHEVAIGVDAFDVRDKLVGLTPPGPFSMMTFEHAVKRLRSKEFRKDILSAECNRLGVLLGEMLEDKEGWHGVERQERYSEIDGKDYGNGRW